ncbi:MAG: PilZ domain-containing protein [Deltaproteobacteria bacterium]|nr:PilZ domain-containing protein [Deltaproteobacteria bacterium]
MSPSSNPSVSERAIVCQRSGELAEFVSLLTTLGMPVEIVNGPLPNLEEIAGAALVIVPGQRLAEGKPPALQRWPRTIAVVDDGSRTLNAHLARIGVSLIVRRPIPPRALRLLILHALYRGPERRSRGRVMIGQPIRAGVGLFKQNATLLELSRTGARIELASPPKIGTLIQFVLGKELTHGKPIKVQAKVVRAIRAADPAGRTTGEIGVALVDPSGEHGRALQAILDRHGSGGTTAISTAGRGASEAAPVRPFTKASPAARPLQGGPATSVAAARPRPFATASLDALARTAATAIPAAPAVPKTMPNATSTSSISAPAAAPTGSAAPSPGGDRDSKQPEPPRRLPPSFVPQATVESLQTEVEIVADASAAEAGVDADADLEAELDRLEGDESDLDFELELDEEIALDEVLAAGASEATLEDERRESARVPYTQRVVALDDQAARVVVGRDLSQGGMRIAPNPELAVGDVVKLALHAGSETQPLVVLAGVERDDGEDGLLLAFASLTAAQRERLEKILAATSSILSTDPLDEDHASESIVMGEVLRRVSRGGGGGHARAGFTLIELMIVVAIIGIIASVAIPVFARYQLRSKSSEVKSNLGAIRIAQEVHRSEHGGYLAAAAEPPLIPGPRATPFEIVGTDYAELGWSPEGRVYFSYAVATSPDASGYTADAAADIDGNGILQIWGYSKPDPLGALTPGGLGCNPAVLDAEEIGSCVVGAPSF